MAITLPPTFAPGLGDSICRLSVDPSRDPRPADAAGPEIGAQRHLPTSGAIPVFYHRRSAAGTRLARARTSGEKCAPITLSTDPF